MTQDKWKNGYIKTLRNEKEIVAMVGNPKYEKAFVLLTIISIRCEVRSEECLIGDYKTYGLTEYEYIRAKKQLKELGYCEFKERNGIGTLAKLLNNNIYVL